MIMQNLTGSGPLLQYTTNTLELMHSVSSILCQCLEGVFPKGKVESLMCYMRILDSFIIHETLLMIDVIFNRKQW